MPRRYVCKAEKHLLQLIFYAQLDRRKKREYRLALLFDVIML